MVGPTAGGYVAVYPADFAHPTVSWVNFGAGATRANAGVLPLSTDGTARLAAAASMVGSANLLVTDLVSSDRNNKPRPMRTTHVAISPD